MNNNSTATQLGRVPPTELSTARRLLHIAVQAVGNLGRAFLPPAADYSHISLSWDAQLRGLLGQCVRTASTIVRAALLFEPASVALLNDKGQILDDWPLEGLALSKFEAQMRRALDGYGLQAAKYSVRSVNPIDLSVLGKSETFRFTQQHDAVMALAAYYDMSATALEISAGTLKSDGIPRVWPHHFDYSLLTPLDKDEGQDSHSITLGMSPGDVYYDQPYFYATPWPYPTVRSLPAVALPAHWHQHEWTGVVLTATDFLGSIPQRPTLEVFWHTAFRLLQDLMART
jgi:hypothetical protein